MRTIVATIALNEEQFVRRWVDAARDADALVIGDTGSTDGTVELARSLGVIVHEVRVRPWRFDIARTTLISLLPDWDDAYVVTCDMDEVMAAGWREKIEKTVADHPDARRLGYDYVWSWSEDGKPDVRFNADRCHSRWGWRWVGPVHEVLATSGLDSGGPVVWAGFGIEHYSDSSKSRSNYLPLLELAVAEEPHNPRQRFYLSREYFYGGQWAQAREGFVAYLRMPEATWLAERADAYRYIAKMDFDHERWLLKAIAEDPTRRDAMVDLVELLAEEGRLIEAAGIAWRALRIAQRPGDYMTTAHSYDDSFLHDVIARSGVYS